jgi:hypothetical protein
MTGSLRVENFGLSDDFIAPGDYDGDGKFDVAVQRGTAGNGPATFYLLQSTAGFASIQWGLSNDFVVPGDYDNDAKTDIAVVRDVSGSFTWYIRLSGSGGALLTVPFGTSATDFTVQNDYDGDGRCDIAVFRDAGGTGTFYVRKTIDGSLIVQQWGTTADFPVASFDTH